MNSLMKITAAFLLTSTLGTSIAHASALNFQPNNGAIFPDANPGGNALMLATAIKPKNNGASSGGMPLFDTTSQGSLLAQSIFAQQQASINNQIFNCGTNTCAASSPVGGIQLGGGYVLAYVHHPDGTVTTTLTDPSGHSTTLTTTYTGSLPSS